MNHKDVIDLFKLVPKVNNLTSKSLFHFKFNVLSQNNYILHHFPNTYRLHYRY